jgi:hypothetical protein
MARCGRLRDGVDPAFAARSTQRERDWLRSGRVAVSRVVDDRRNRGRRARHRTRRLRRCTRSKEMGDRFRRCVQALSDLDRLRRLADLRPRSDRYPQVGQDAFVTGAQATWDNRACRPLRNRVASSGGAFRFRGFARIAVLSLSRDLLPEQQPRHARIAGPSPKERPP